jgi:predicted outer membrane repeat protein
MSSIATQQQHSVAISAVTDGEVLIDTCTFTGSSATTGGALSLSTSDSKDRPVQFNVKRSVFDDNRASENGNAIYVTGGVLSLTYSTVRNHVYKQHEAVFTAASLAYISDSLFHDNVGGAISTGGKTGVQLIVERSNFVNNTAVDVSAAVEAQLASVYLSEVIIHKHR